MADCFRDAQIALSVRQKGSKMCPIHKEKTVIYVCLDCSELACVTCATKEHSRHSLTELSDCIPEIKHKLIDYMKEVEENEIPLIDDTIKSATEELRADKYRVQEQVKEIRKQRDYIKNKLDTATEALVQRLYVKGSENTDMLFKHIENLRNRRGRLQSELRIIQDVFESSEDVQIYDLKDIPTDFEDVIRPNKHTISFTPKEISLSELETLFGENVIGSSDEETYSQPARRYDLKNEPNNWNLSAKFTPFSNQFVTSLCHAPGDLVWAGYFTEEGKYNRVITLINANGVIQQNLNFKVNVRDICLSRKTAAIWFCCKNDNCIREVSRGQPVVRFKTNREPESICLTADDHIVIGHIGQVVKYSQTGVIIKQTDVLYPYHISECPKTRRLAVVDLDWNRHRRGPDGKPFVSIVDSNLAPLYTYRGDRGHQSSRQIFHPQDVCYTSAGDLVITDRENKEVVLVNCNGEYKYTIYTVQESFPAAVCSNNDGSLWISIEDGSVHVLLNY